MSAVTFEVPYLSIDWLCMLSHFSCVWLIGTLWTVACKLLCPWDSSGSNTGMGCHALLQGHLPNPRIELVSPTSAAGFFTTSTIWEAPSQQQMKLNNNWLVISMLFFDSPEKKKNKLNQVPFFYHLWNILWSIYKHLEKIIQDFS